MAGNYYKDLNVDSFEFTSPVGSFLANKTGLHDMGGNVWEWCEDWFDPKVKEARVLRGASYDFNSPGLLLSSYRMQFEPDSRFHVSGFRCVLFSIWKSK